MKVQLFDIFDEAPDRGAQPERSLSFDRFLDHLVQLYDNGAARQGVLAFVLARFRQAQAKYGTVTADNLTDFSEELHYIYNLSVPLLTNEQTALWGLAFPVSGKIFYGTDTFYEFIQRERLAENVADKLEAINGSSGSMMVYQLIFERLYGFSSGSSHRLVYAVDDEPGLPTRYYAVKLDNTFVEVTAEGTLPTINYEVLRGKKPNEVTEADLARVVPLDRFRIKGFSIISLEDITHEYVIDELMRISMRSSEYGCDAQQKDIEANLRLLTGVGNLHTWIAPFLKLNGKPLIQPDLFGDGGLYNRIVAEVGEKRLLDYLSDPYMITFQIDAAPPGAPSFFDAVAETMAFGSMAVIPLFHNGITVGLLGLYTETGPRITANALAHLRPAIPVLAQFVNDIGLDFKARLDTVILDRFTALQPAVQWKFNEAAWAYLSGSEEREGGNTLAGRIRFEQVYPMYGAVDIRNSTLKRNKALVADLNEQLDLLLDTLLEIDGHHSVPRYLIQRTEELKMRLAKKQVDYVQTALPAFLDDEVKVAFNVLKPVGVPLDTLIRGYEQKMGHGGEHLNRHKRAFESAIDQVNQTISTHLDAFNEQVQAVYPSYFEKFRTDGVEFDCYVGQSISPHIPFKRRFLTELKRLQLEVMVRIAKETHTLALQSDIALETTQLIFVNNGEIAISFREDERRFDVEGDYNIRYHVIKKRIDKAVVKGTKERITQPGKITLVYLYQEALYDYMAHIGEMQRWGILTEEMEYLELESLQGVTGLHALRVTVDMAKS